MCTSLSSLIVMLASWCLTPGTGPWKIKKKITLEREATIMVGWACTCGPEISNRDGPNPVEDRN